MRPYAQSSLVDADLSLKTHVTRLCLPVSPRYASFEASIDQFHYPCSCHL